MMKKLIFLLAFVPVFAMAQDTTAASITDSTRMYTYKNTYVALRGISMIPSGSWRGIIGTQDTTKWTTTISMAVYTSKADQKSGKPELFAYQLTLITDEMPTYKQLQARVKASIK